VLVGDGFRLRQCITNIADNAVKFSKQVRVLLCMCTCMCTQYYYICALILLYMHHKHLRRRASFRSSFGGGFWTSESAEFKFACFTSTKVQTLTQLLRQVGGTVLDLRECGVYLRYWYNSTNTDSAAATGWGRGSGQGLDLRECRYS
jgi:hypothetical protein